MKNRIRLTTLVEIAISVALAVALSYLKFFRMPQGGSVSLQMVPIVVLAVRCGTIPGLIGGLLFGIIRMMLSPAFYYPLQALLDYPIAFTTIGLAGIWVRYGKDKIDYLRNGLALVFVFGLRFISHMIAGKLFFSEYAPEGMNEWWYAITYNAAHLVPELIVTLIVIMVLMTRREIFERKHG